MKNYNYIKNNFIKNSVYYDSNLINLQPDYVLKSGYTADMTMYYLASLRIMDYVYKIDTSKEFKAVQNGLVNMLWQEDKGFFIDWIDTNGTKHVHFGTEQLWGIVLDVLPSNIQKRMFEVMPKSQTFSGRFWLFAPYDYPSEKTCLIPDWDNKWKIGQLMLYVQTLRKFDYNANFIISEINEYDSTINKYGFIDFYVRLENGTLIQDGMCNYIMNAGSWICIVNNNDLSIPLTEINEIFMREFSVLIILFGMACLIIIARYWL